MDKCKRKGHKKKSSETKFHDAARQEAMTLNVNDKF